MCTPRGVWPTGVVTAASLDQLFCSDIRRYASATMTKRAKVAGQTSVTPAVAQELAMTRRLARAPRAMTGRPLVLSRCE
jgi:hypothetical protein